MTKKELLKIADRAAGLLASNDMAGFDVFVKTSASTSVEVKEQKLDAFEESESWGIGIRVLTADGRMGFAYSTGTERAAEDAASMALTNARSAAPDDFNTLPAPQSLPYPDVLEYDESALGMTEREKIERAMSLEKAAMDFDGRVKRVRKASASFTSAQWAVASSTGMRAASIGTYFDCGIMAVAEDAGDSQMGYDFDFKRRVSDIDFAGVGRSAAEKAVMLLGARKAASGMFPVLLENMVAASFLGVLAQSFSAEAVIKGRSLFRDKLGELVCGRNINICDDGVMPGGNASRAFDDEGVPSQRTPIIVEGVLKNFLHNAYTAKKMGTVSTGNGVRGGFRATPSVGGTNLHIPAGAALKADAVSYMSKGLIVQEVLGMHTANPISGDFSVGVSGQWVEGGKVAYPVREAAIAGNVLDVFKGIEAVCDDLRFMGRIGSPSLLLRPISVSGS